MKQKNKPTSGMFRSLILRDGMMAAPLAAFADSLEAGAVLCIGFLCISAVTVFLTSVLPRRIPFSVRILLYSAVGSLVYIPTALMTSMLFPEHAGGIYLALLASSLFVTAEHDRVYPKKGTLRSLLSDIAGTWSVTLVFSLLREVFGAGTLYRITVFENPPLPVLQNPAGGLVMLACCCIAAEAVFRNREEVDANAGSC